MSKVFVFMWALFLFCGCIGKIEKVVEEVKAGAYLTTDVEGSAERVSNSDHALTLYPKITKIDTIKYHAGTADGFIFIRAWSDSIPLRLKMIKWDAEGNESREYSECNINKTTLFRFDSTFSPSGKLIKSQVQITDFDSNVDFTVNRDYTSKRMVLNESILIDKHNQEPLVLYVREGNNFGKITDGYPPTKEYLSETDFNMAFLLFNYNLKKIKTYWSSEIPFQEIKGVIRIDAPHMYDHPPSITGENKGKINKIKKSER